MMDEISNRLEESRKQVSDNLEKHMEMVNSTFKSVQERVTELKNSPINSDGTL